MSTLPQTTPIAVPRPAAPGVIPGGAPGAGNTTGAQLNAADAWRVIRTNMWLIIISVVISAVLGLVVNILLNSYYPRYTAQGLVQVLPYNTNPNPLVAQTSVDNNALERDQRTQVQLLKQEALISNVLQNPNSAVRNTRWFAEFNGNTAEAKKKLFENFSVSAYPESRLIGISMTYAVPQDCKTIVEEIVDRALKDQAQNNQNKQYDKSLSLNALKVKYESDKRNLEQDLRDRSAKLSLDGTIGGSGRLGMKELELSNLVSEQIVVGNQLISTQSAAASIEQAVKSGQVPPRVQDAVEHDPEILQVRSSINAVDLSMSEIASRQGTAHENYKSLVTRKQSLTDHLEQLRNDVRIKMTAEITEQLKNQVLEQQTALDTINKRIEKSKSETGELANNMNAYEAIRVKIANLEDNLRKVNTELDNIASTTLGGGDIQWVQKPITPDTPSFPVLKATLTIAIILGLGLALGIAFLREIMDTTVRSPRDLARVGQMNLLGIVPDEHDDPQASGARLPLVIFEAPHSITAENLRQIRTRLQHTASLDTTRSMLMTSANPGDGKTTIAVNLAAGLALTGRKILLVDANFRRPDLHKLFGLDNAQGFSTVLANLDSFAVDVKETNIPNLMVLPTGPKPTNTTEMLESQLLPDFIARALQDYDHVIFDGPPMLFSSEAVAMAPKVDGVITVVRARSNTRGVLQRVRDSLKQTKAEHLGVVLNGVQSYGGGYYARNIKTYYEYSGDAV